MPTRTAYAGTAADGDVYTAANHARMPGGLIGYGTRVTDISVAATTTTILTVAPTVGPSRLVRASFSLPKLRLFNASGPGSATLSVNVRIQQDGSNVWDGEVRAPTDSTLGNAFTIPFAGSVILAPTTGAHTYNVTVFSGGAAARGDVLASAVSPAVLMVEDLGPAF